MKIRKATESDIGSIMEIYAAARKYMEKTGNGTQWGKTRPPRSQIEEDIRKGQCFAGLGDDGCLHFVFAFIRGDDPAYAVIRDGNWLNNEPYGVIHRIASDGQVHGVFHACVGFCREQCQNLRIDTHENNKTMQHLLQKNRFIRCGTIYLENGDPRIAYQRSWSR